MPCLFHRLLDVLAGSSQNDLRRQIQYLKAENEVLRSKIPGPVRMTAQERSRLARLGVDSFTSRSWCVSCCPISTSASGRDDGDPVIQA